MIFIILGIYGLVVIYSLYQWFYELRFNLRKTIQSFDEYGRKRGLLKLRKKPIMIGLFALLSFTSLIIAGQYLITDFYYYWSILIPVVPFNLMALAIIMHEKSYDTLSIDNQFLDDEYFSVIDAEKNIESFFQEVERLNDSLTASKMRIQEKMKDSSQFFHQFEQSDYFDAQFKTIENQAFTQMKTQRDTVQTLKDNFVVIAQEYIDNSRKVTLNQSNVTNLTKIGEYFTHITDIETQANQQIIQWIRQAISNNQLKSLTIYYTLVEHLRVLGYEVTTDDILVIFKNYPARNEEEQNVYIDILFSNQLATVEFFKQFVIPQELNWLLSEQFYTYFKTADIKEIFAEAIQSESSVLIDQVLDTLNPKYVSYLSDIIVATQAQSKVAHKILLYDELFQRLNQFLSASNATENYFYVLKESSHDSKSLKDFIDQIESKDFSTPAIAQEIRNQYLDKFSEHKPLFIAAFNLFMMYRKSVKEAKSEGLLNINTNLDALLESMFRLNISLVKTHLILMIFNLYTMSVPWHMNQEHAHEITHILKELGLDKTFNLDDLLMSDSNTLYKRLVVPYTRKMNINKATLDQLIMRTEIHRETLDDLA